MRFLSLVAAFALLLAMAPTASAGLVVVGVSTNDQGSVNALSIDFGNALAIAVTLDQYVYGGFSINAQSVSTGPFEAYLMDGIGPQASGFNQIDHTTFSITAPEPTMIPLFTGGFQPGVYFLVVGTTDPDAIAGWSSTTAPVVTETAGLGLRGDILGYAQYYATGADVDTGFLPASNFVPDDLLSGDLMYEVTSVPEPSTWLLMTTATAGLALWRRRRGRAGRTNS